MKKKEPILVHNHTSKSNFRLKDATNEVETLLEYALKLGLPGLAITDHETLSAHIQAEKYIDKHSERFKDFKMILGNEIYLCDREQTEYAWENNEKTSYPHFILLAKDLKGHKALRILSSKAWSNSKWHRGMERVPTFKDDLTEVMKEYKGHLIATTACLGGEINQYTAQIDEIEQNPSEDREEDFKKIDEIKEKIKSFVSYLFETFGKENVYFEQQPSNNDRQKSANKWLERLSRAYNVKCVVTTDAHYLNEKQARDHEIYLQSVDGDREVKEFYSTTYLMNRDQLLEFFEEDKLDIMIENTHSLAEEIESYSLKMRVTIPVAQIPEFEMTKLFEPFYKDYEFIKYMSESKEMVDKYYMSQLAKGLLTKKVDLTREILSRINTEVMEIWQISEALEQPMSGYFVLTQDIVDIMWQFSLVGPSRGSAACFYTNYLLDIVQFSAIEFNLPHWRFLSASKVEIPDIDLDSESSRRKQIIEAVKDKYGRENVLNMGTITTEGIKSAIITSCRGVGLDRDLAQSISNLIPYEKREWPIKDLLEGNREKNREPVKELLFEVEKHEGLKDTMITISGITSGRGQHASGVVVFPSGYINQNNAMMKTTSGLEITQFDAKDTEYAGGLKLDFLSITSLDRIRTAIEILIKEKKIEEMSTLRETYNRYFHPDILEFEAEEMYNLLFEGHIFNAFQFETELGQSVIKKLNARSFDELAAANNLMRLSGEGEQPIDKFIKFKNNPQLWYDEMDSYGLTEEDEEPLKELLTSNYGICDSQELIMQLFMHPKISNSNLAQANKFRKAVAKQDKIELAEQKILFFEMCENNEVSHPLRDYVWKYCFEPTFGYAFSAPHTHGYTLVLMIQMNICYRYGSIYWKTACMTVNSGLVGDNIDGGISYGAVAQASNELKDSIVPPDVNLSELGFVPLIEEDKILFGFKPIAGLSTSAAETIINNRPYSSFEEFYHKIVEIEKVPISQVIISIKSGMFSRFEEDRRKVMIDFINHHIPKRKKLTLVQVPKLINSLKELKLLESEIEHYEWRTKLQGRNKVEFDEYLEEAFLLRYDDKVEYDYDENGKLVVDLKSFGKYFEESIKDLRAFLNTDQAIEIFNRMEKNEFWQKNCSGSPLQWEMETTMTQLKDHEINHMPLAQYLHISNHSDIPQIPKVERFRTLRDGRRLPVFQTFVIAGTVVDKTSKGYVYLSTPDGLIPVRYSRGQFKHYDKKEVVQRENEDGKKVKVTLDESWFKRGSRIVVSGFIQDGEFIVRKGNQFGHTTLKILNYTQESVKFQSEKRRR